MFGHHPRTAVDLALRCHEPSVPMTSCDYINGLKEDLKKAYELAESSMKHIQADQKDRYDKRICGAVLELGDKFLLCNVGLQGTHKIADKWSQDVYVEVEQPNSGIPVYKVKPELEVGELRDCTVICSCPYPVCHWKVRQCHSKSLKVQLTRQMTQFVL